jgi:hypothetical protein
MNGVLNSRLSLNSWVNNVILSPKWQRICPSHSAESLASILFSDCPSRVVPLLGFGNPMVKVPIIQQGGLAVVLID